PEYQLDSSTKSSRNSSPTSAATTWDDPELIRSKVDSEYQALPLTSLLMLGKPMTENSFLVVPTAGTYTELRAAHQVRVFEYKETWPRELEPAATHSHHSHLEEVFIIVQNGPGCQLDSSTKSSVNRLTKS